MKGSEKKSRVWIQKNARRLCILVFLLSMGISCVERFDAKIETFESALVIEATITNELKRQEILLSRTFRFEETGPLAESGATVTVSDDAQNTYIFEEELLGRYVSTIEFSAQPNTAYQLSIITPDGRMYSSDPTILTQNTVIDALYADAITNDDEIEGVGLFVDSFDASGNSQYYRFTYEETYKIVAPLWNPLDLVITSNADPLIIDLLPKSQEEEVCYNTVGSNTIILGNTNTLAEDRLSRFLVRFLARDNYIIGHRYSILVRQFVVSREAHTFYTTLNEFSGTESLFSENQPGFFNGNVFSESNSEEKVLGFFNVSSVATKRVFFNHRDFYPEDLVATFPDKCHVENPIVPDLLSGIRGNRIKYFANIDPFDPAKPFLVVPRICGDCTVLGSNVVPEFWVD